ncbi:MAG: FtsX-like permease family protein [Terriglobales bacterium]
MVNNFWRWVRRRRLERDSADELAAHVALRADANRAAGMEAATAERDARRRLGSELALRERMRAADLPLRLDESVRDLATAGRMLRRRPGFAALAIATLALGVGVATAMFSVLRTVVLDPLPFPDAARLVQVDATVARLRGRNVGTLPATVVPAIESANIFASVGTIGFTRRDATVYAGGFATQTHAVLATSGLFTTLGVHPNLGHGFTGAGAEAIVSSGFFRHELHGDLAALGGPLRVGDNTYTVVGVLPAGEEYPPRGDVWLESQPTADGSVLVIARLPADAPLAAAQARAAAAVTALGTHVPHGPFLSGLALAPMQPWLVADTARRALWVLLAASICLLLIACGNTANLLLARGLERQRELAVRRALGASPARLARLLLAEGAWLALTGGPAGVGLAWLLVRLARLGPANIPRFQAARLHPPALALAAGLAVLCGLVCALAPALRLSRPGFAHAALHSSQMTRTPGLRRVLVAAEIAITLALLIGGALLVRTFTNIERVDLGFNPQHVTELRVLFPPRPAGVDPGKVWPQRDAQFQLLLSRLRALPGIESAGLGSVPPFASGAMGSLVGVQTDNLAARLIEIGDGYFRTLGIRLLAGRGFTPAERDTFTPSVYPAVINATLAGELWPGRTPAQALGARLHWMSSGTMVVVGVAADVNDVPGALAEPSFYVPALDMFSAATVFLRSDLPPGALGTEVRGALPAVGHSLTLTAPETLDDAMAAALLQPRFRALLLATFAGLAWALALVGLYGVMAYEVRQRQLEIGIRIAFGARNADVLRLILGQSLGVLAAGLGAGWLLYFYLARYLSALLFGVRALDPATWLGAGAVLLAAGVLASLVPARRALRVNPADSLRCE